MKFTYAAYVEFVETLLANGYVLRHLDQPDRMPPPSEAWVMLRHDVDMSLGPAVEMARREAAHGISTDYYILTTSPFYNPLSGEGRRAIQDIVALGHRVGLHFDATVYPDRDLDGLNEACRREVDLVGDVAGTEPVGVSFHRPIPELIGSGPEITAPWPHTYAPFFVRETEYCTDSTGRWRYGPPDERDAVRAGNALHLVTHPIWWAEDEQTAERRLGTFLAAEAARRREAVAAELAVVPE
ncbi:MAG: hypothetical protein KDB40_22330 [Acidimicrobiales bacterium]|nr:hypothetical protein [Acidimicrobiales bacterium]MCB9394910.1 hypothetical protein [Acidimicrobiaceae bacterium]